MVVARVRSLPSGTRGGDPVLLDLLRLEWEHARQGAVLLSEGTLPWSSGAPAGRHFDRVLHWHASEPVVFAPPTTALIGETLSVAEPPGVPPAESDHHEGQRGSGESDQRAAEFQARHIARDRYRERAREFLKCPLEHVEIVAESVAQQHNRTARTRVTIVSGRTTAEGPFRPPPDIPVTHVTFTPVLLGRVLSTGPSLSALLLMEEERLSYSIWQDGELLMLRTWPLGGERLLEEIAHALPCTRDQASALFTRGDRGLLRADAFRIVAEALRPLRPLYSAAWSDVARAALRLQRPRSCAIAGLWPHLVTRLLFRASPLESSLHLGTTLAVLTGNAILPIVAGKDRDVDDRVQRKSGSPRIPEPQRSLLCLVGAAALRVSERLQDGMTPAARAGGVER